MFGIGGFELFLILLFGFLIFGPDKLPAMAKTIGKAIAKFRNAQEEMSGVLKGEMVFDKDAEDPFKNPLDALDEAAAKAKKGADSAKKAASAAPRRPPRPRRAPRRSSPWSCASSSYSPWASPLWR